MRYNESGLWKGARPMQLGLSTAAFYGRWETEEAAERIARLPLDCAEVFLQTASEYTREFARETRERLAGVPCTSVHPLGTGFENGIVSRSPRQRRDTFGVFLSVLDAAQELGARAYVYHGRHSPRLQPLPWNLELNAKALTPMCEEAEKRGMVIAWENVFWCQLTAPERVREARAVLPQVRFTLDIKQAMLAGCDPVGFVYAMGDALSNVHICDWDGSGRLYLPGEGTFDFLALFRAMREVGYDGPVIMEPYLELIGSDGALSRSIDFLREQMRLAERG